jgi:hypothetical protein
MHGQAYKLGISHSSKTAFEIAGLSLLYRFLGDVNYAGQRYNRQNGL